MASNRGTIQNASSRMETEDEIAATWKKLRRRIHASMSAFGSEPVALEMLMANFRSDWSEDLYSSYATKLGFTASPNPKAAVLQMMKQIPEELHCGWQQQGGRLKLMVKVVEKETTRGVVDTVDASNQFQSDKRIQRAERRRSANASWNFSPSSQSAPSSAPNRHFSSSASVTSSFSKKMAPNKQHINMGRDSRPRLSPLTVNPKTSSFSSVSSRNPSSTSPNATAKDEIDKNKNKWPGNECENSSSARKWICSDARRNSTSPSKSSSSTIPEVKEEHVAKERNDATNQKENVIEGTEETKKREGQDGNCKMSELNQTNDSKWHGNKWENSSSARKWMYSAARGTSFSKSAEEHVAKWHNEEKENEMAENDNMEKKEYGDGNCKMESQIETEPRRQIDANGDQSIVGSKPKHDRYRDTIFMDTEPSDAELSTVTPSTPVHPSTPFEFPRVLSDAEENNVLDGEDDDNKFFESKWSLDYQGVINQLASLKL